jgi:hypothetical protein
MKREFIYVPPYERQAKRKKVSESVERNLEQLVLEKPDRGTLLAKTGGIRKLRVGDEEHGVGKSGAYRFFYLDIESAGWTFVLWVIHKSENGNISAEVRNQLHELVKVLREEVSRAKKRT